MRKFRIEDVPAVTVLLNDYLSRFDLTPVFSEQDVQHWFLPQVRILGNRVERLKLFGCRKTSLKLMWLRILQLLGR